MADRFNNEPRSNFVYKWLIEAIKFGDLTAGSRINEDKIAKTLGVSRTPVREAIQLLHARRMIDSVPGRGLVIVELTLQQVLGLYAMREVLEGGAARFAAQHAVHGEIDILHGLLEEFEAAEGDAKRLSAVNIALHQTIYDAARNRYLREALSGLEDSLSLLRSTTFSMRERFSSAVREHRAIVEAIELRDAEAAEAASRYHIREAQRARVERQFVLARNPLELASE